MEQSLPRAESRGKSTVSRGTALLAAALVLSLLGCAEELRGRPPLDDGLYYPIAGAVDQANGLLYVVNSNFDLAYRDASLVAVDLNTHKFVPGFASFGSFPADFLLVPSKDGKKSTGYLAVRGDNSLTWFTSSPEGDGVTLECSDDGKGSGCSGDHVITDTVLPAEDDAADSEDEEVTLGSDPFALALIPAHDEMPARLFLAASKSGTLSLFDLEDDGKPVLSAQSGMVAGAHTAALDPATGLIYVTNRLYPYLYRFEVVESDSGPKLQSLDPVPLPSPYAASGQYGRGMAFSGDGRYLLLAYRAPAGIAVVDALPEESDWAPSLVDFVPVGPKPGQVRLFPTGPGGKELAYVVCYGDDSVWVVDPEALLVVDRFEVGAGPYDMVVHLSDKPRGYVVNFLDNSVSVVDLDPVSPWYHQTVAEIH